jgi:hypothetical protein
VSVVTKEMLDAAILIGRSQERERILDLLNNQCKCFLPDEWHPDTCTCQKFIALIKGETK